MFLILRRMPNPGVLFELGPKLHVLMLLVHHIAFDAWSVAQLMREISRRHTGLAVLRGTNVGAATGAVRRLTLWQRKCWVRRLTRAV